MLNAELVVFGVVLATLALLASGRLRYDLVALLALLALAATGLTSGEAAFAGFGHPAVITVAAVLVISRGLQRSGIVERLALLVGRAGDSPGLQLALLLVLVTVASAFMNNVGALALFMPVAIRLARKAGRSPSLYLMPLAFASLLGGLMTLIGTPPNIIIATFRAATPQAAGQGFGMFDFAPVGAAVALAGLAFMLAVGTRLIPERRGSGDQDLFEVQGYLTELRLPEDSRHIGKRLKELRAALPEGVDLVELVRGAERILAPSGRYKVKAGDRFLMRASGSDLEEMIGGGGLEMAEESNGDSGDNGNGGSELRTFETVVRPGALLEGRTVEQLKLRSVYGLAVLAVARQAGRLRTRVGRIRLRAGDIVLLEGQFGAETPEVLTELGLLPLAERSLSLKPPRQAALAVAVFGGAVALATAGLLPVAVALTGAAAVMVVAKVLSLREAYEAIDWPIIVLLGAMFPLSGALESSGAAARLAGWVLSAGGSLPGWASVTIILVGTMFLSDVVNNAAAAMLMAPVAVAVAAGMGASGDPFLMAVALGASCAFLTPIGHQSNTLVMGPGGYKFGDYWRVGLPLELVIVLVGVPVLLRAWPL